MMAYYFAWAPSIDALQSIGKKKQQKKQEIKVQRPKSAITIACARGIRAPAPPSNSPKGKTLRAEGLASSGPANR
jgi:hypothetical protein